MTENLKLWNSVATTPGEYTYPSLMVQPDGSTLTLVKTQYRLLKMTEIFGPVGEDWGWERKDRWREDWGSVSCAYVEIVVWYKQDGHRFETGPQIGGWRAGENVEDIWMAATTRAIAKCMASIGLCADVYMGEFDGSSPVSQKGESGHTQRIQPGPIFDKTEPAKPPLAPAPPKTEIPPEASVPLKKEPEPEPPIKEEPKTEEKPKPKPSGRPNCPGCGSQTVGVGRNGKPNHCWDCNTDFDNNGTIITKG